MKASLALVDVKVLDHFIVAGKKMISFAERGLIKLFCRACPDGTKTGKPLPRLAWFLI